MNLVENILTKNRCYLADRKITVKGLMLHSVGCPQPNAAVFLRNWNSASVGACVHAFIDGNTGTVYQTLPWDHRGWHAGDDANNTHIGVEMCEPDTIRYTSGANWEETGDGKNTAAVVDRTYKAAVELFAMLCKKFDLDPEADGVIISHSEGAKRGIASGHADVEHIWDKFGYTMNGFRKDVAAAMTPEKADKLYRVQVGAFGEKARAEAYRDKLKAAGFPVYIVSSGKIYKIQVGAFQDKSLADALLAKVKAAGFDAFITTETAPVVQATLSADDPAKSYAKAVAGLYTVTASALNVRNGAGTGKSIMVTIPKGTIVKNFGYYTVLDGVKWLYIQFTHEGATYNGFAHSGYLRKV